MCRTFLNVTLNAHVGYITTFTCTQTHLCTYTHTPPMCSCVASLLTPPPPPPPLSRSLEHCVCWMQCFSVPSSSVCLFLHGIRRVIWMEEGRTNIPFVVPSSLTSILLCLYPSSSVSTLTPLSLPSLLCLFPHSSSQGIRSRVYETLILLVFVTILALGFARLLSDFSGSILVSWNAFQSS